MAIPEKRRQTAILYVRVKPEVKAMLAAQADAQGRSLANYLEWLIRQQPPVAPCPTAESP